jgi:hypothetical protein
MANESTVGFGFRAANRLGNLPSIQGQTKYQLQTAPGVALMKNDPASIQDGGNQGFIQDASFATTDDGGTGGAAYDNSTEAKLVGVLNGFFFIDSTTLKPTFANNVAASQAFGTNPNTGSTNGFAFVNNDPYQEYICKADAAVPQAEQNDLAFNCNNNDGSNKDGQSVVTLEMGSANAATSMFTIIGTAEDPENEDITAAGCNVRVVMAAGARLYG